MTVPADRQGEAEALATEFDCGLTWIGIVEKTPGLRCVMPDGTIADAAGGYDHFAGSQ